MFLISLTVFKNNNILREISFKRGLNIIVNSANPDQSSGNSVGKSTLSRLLDYMFLSNGKEIYTESEHNNPIPQVVDFIKNNKVLVELKFIGYDENKYTIGRTLTLTASKSEYYIDSEEANKKDYERIVASQVFGLSSEKPTVRTVSNKFIRNTNYKMQNTTRFLFPTTKHDVYDQLYLFLFGFSELDLLKKKAKLNLDIVSSSQQLTAYRQPYKESVLRKMIVPLHTEEKEIIERIESYDFTGTQDDNVKSLVKIQSEISDLTIRYSKVKSKSMYLNKSIESLKENSTSINGKYLQEIYLDAKVSISGELLRSMEDLMIFHNKVINNKISYINAGITECLEEEGNLREEISSLQKHESELLQHIKEPSVLKSIAALYQKLSNIKEEIARANTLLSRIEEVKASLAKLEEQKQKVVDRIQSNTDSLNSNVSHFNRLFGELSKCFYDERYIFDLNFDSEKERCSFEVVSVTPNSTGGKKKGELSAFDMAYIKLVKELGLKRPTFVVHDSIEDVDVNQVHDIFKTADKLDGQYIIALMRDKIAGQKFSGYLEESTILELSENDKFFKI
ncbi:DUF2326 domain-containing protein [Cobetia sp. MMG027]|uniref:DUF2326 domain-containing protein n=1 Tax=Cobetia sp. MMG027 TaxID=3021980 RepID=UPI0022FE00C0|nr:DUF2326 domain-containing protein [Cobetia sp. MMG027]MDA5562610.1 DUF2326 domain-containing protein [Cobetia sp. MMG027]